MLSLVFYYSANILQISTIFIIFLIDRLKDLTEEQYTHAEAEIHAGKTKEILPSVRELRAQMIN